MIAMRADATLTAIHANQIANWKTQFLENAPGLAAPLAAGR
jgi:hypothetical protein